MFKRGWEKEQMKTTKDMDGQCETRPSSKGHGLENKHGTEEGGEIL